MTFAQSYDRFRPRPPRPLLELFCRLAGVERPELVVDLGSGTGLSTRAWVGLAERVVGVEPHDGMRAVAEATGGAEYVSSDSSATGLPDACADIVTASQSLHWMDPAATFAEVGRILRPGGVFAAYDYDAAPAIHPEIDAAHEAVLDRAQELRRDTGVLAPWAPRHHVHKDEHLANMRASGAFRYVRDLQAHSVEDGDADRLLGMIRSFGGVAMHEHEELGLDRLEAVARRILGDRTVPFWFGYRVRLGIR